MGWKRIGNHLYYYRSRRVGGQVTTEYVGRGELGALFAQLDELDRQDRLARQAERQDERDEAEDEERADREWFDAIETVATGAMLAAGYRKHHGQWRRERNGDDERHDGAQAPRDGGAQDSREDDVG